MKLLLRIVPKVVEVALSISPVTRPYVQPFKAACLGLDLTVMAVEEFRDK